MLFDTWVDTFLSEKGIDLEHVLEVPGPYGGVNLIPVGVLMERIKGAPTKEQQGIKNTLVRIDSANGDVLQFLHHLAKAIAI